MNGPGEIRLDELNKDEWHEVVMHIDPNFSEHEFEEAWNDFIHLKQLKTMQ